MKKILTLVLAMAFMSNAYAQTTTDFIFANQSFASPQIISSGTIDGNLSYDAAKNSSSTSPTYYTAGNALRMYADKAGGDGNSFTISTSNGAKITSLTIVALAGYTPKVTYSIDGSDYQEAILSENSYTISGLNATSSLTFKNAVTEATTQLRTTALSITYTGGTLAITDTKSAKKMLVKNTVVGDEISFGAKANVKVYNMNGQLVKTASVEKDSKLNVSSLAKGNYVVTGEVNGQKISQKFVKE